MKNGKLHDRTQETIKSAINEPPYSAFLCERHWYNNTTIAIDEINSSDHPDYVNKTWKYVLENAPRMESNLKLLEQNPGYYLSTAKKQPELSFKAICWKGHDTAKFMFPYHNGNHRTAIIKAYLHGFTQLHGVTLFKDVYDYELYQAYECLKHSFMYSSKPYIRVEVVRTDSSFVDELDYSVCSNNLALKITNHKSGVELLLNANEAYELFEECGIIPLRRLFRKNRYSKFLR